MNRFFLVLFLPIFGLAAGCGNDEVAGPEPLNVHVQLSPDSSAVHNNECVEFRASVTGCSDTSIVWALDGKAHGDTSIGAISATGLYTSPGRIPETFVPITVQVTAASRVAPSSADTAFVTLLFSDGGLRIELSPFESTLGFGERAVLEAGIENASDPAVVWSVDPIPGIPDVGQVEAGGAYVAPEALTDAVTVTVRATSLEDPSKSGVALVHLIPANLVTLEIDPAEGTLETNRSLSFQAQILNCPDTRVIWSVEGKAGGDSLSGIISPTGRYTAPAHVPSSSPVTIRATSVAQPARYVEAEIVIEPSAAGPSIVLCPTEVRVAFGDLQRFQAELWKTAAYVDWSVDEIPEMIDAGQVDGDGLYTAPLPAYDDSATVVVRATSVADPSKSAAAIIHLYPPPVKVHLSPTPAVVGLGQDLFFEFSVENASDTGLDWYVNGSQGGNASLGTMYDAGRYRAPATLPDPAIVEIKAVSREDPSRYAVATVEIVPPWVFEAERFTAANDRGGLPIKSIDKWAYGASADSAVEGLDRILEWIEVPIVIEHAGAYKISFRHASDASVKGKISIPGCGPEGQDREWILQLNAGGCG